MIRGDRIRALREAANLTQQELAAEIGSSEPQIWRYEKNESEPRADVVIKLAQYFNISADYLLGLTDNPSVNIDSSLSPREASVISAWRSGQRLDAVKTIINDD